MHKFISLIFVVVIIVSAFSVNALSVEFIDGTYEVNIALWHSEDDRESMAADSVGKTATIVVKNNTKTMHITSSEMSVMGIKASLQELKVEDANGNFVEAKVATRNSEGNPTGFYFTMPNTNKYIAVKVNPHIAIMGYRDIGARIKVDYSTLKLVKPAKIQKENSTVTENLQPSGKAGEEIAETNMTKVETESFENSPTEKESATITKELLTETEPSSVKKESSGINYTTAIISLIICILTVIFVVTKTRRKNKS